MPSTARSPRTLTRPPLRRRPAVWPRLRRRPVAWWAVTLVLALTTATVISRAVADAEAGAARYGRTRQVLVATTAIAPGAVISEGNAEVQALPDALVPPGAADVGDLGARATSPIHQGEVVHGRRLAPGGLSAVTALLPAGTRGIAVPSGSGALPLQVGDVVDVLATIESHEGEVPPTVTVAAGAIVVDVGEAAITLAVAVEQAPKVAYAVTAGLVTLALVAG